MMYAEPTPPQMMHAEWPAQPVKTAQVCSADAGFFQPPAGYVMCMLPAGRFLAEFCAPAGAPPAPAGFGGAPHGCFAPEARLGPKEEHLALAGAAPPEGQRSAAACAAEPAPEPAAEEAPAPEELERRKRLLRLTPSGATSAAVLLAKRRQIEQARKGDRATVGALNLAGQKQNPKAPQLRFLKELEDKKRQEERTRRSCTKESSVVSSESTAAPISDEEAADRDEAACAPPSLGFAGARAALLSYRCVAPCQKPRQLQGLFADAARAGPECPSAPALRRQCSAPAPAAPPRPVLQRQRTEPAPSPLSALRRDLGELETLRRDVNSLLNKVCPEKFGTVVEKLTAIRVESTEALEIVIELIFKKALSEPHYSETYADLVFSLRSAFPEFPAPDGGKPMTFKSSVLHICQAEFEELLAAPEPSESERAGRQGEDLEALCQERRGRMRANMRFVGHLFLRQLLSAKVVGGILRELVLCDMEDVAPQEHALECAHELLNSVGLTLESMPFGQVALPVVFGRLRSLKARKGADGKGIYSKRMQFMIQDLIDTREAGWTRKVFRSSAKTIEEIRAAGTQQQGGETVLVGQRPLYMAGEAERFVRTRTA
ncbi:unnamed protein product [Prorocentrum cordatum]|uniref:MIF4G domain-containing protein n=1 Tax=Prorocentrum cordatum TaxID=2364126 RepID=A0ABN9TBW0_9DINO|nr:unnamed protein product [Polarella glacialis]